MLGILLLGKNNIPCTLTLYFEINSVANLKMANICSIGHNTFFTEACNRPNVIVRYLHSQVGPLYPGAHAHVNVPTPS